MAQNSQHWSAAWHPYALLHHSPVLLWWLQTWKAASQPPPGKTTVDAAEQSPLSIWQSVAVYQIKKTTCSCGVCLCWDLGALRLQQCAGWVLTTLLICLWTRFLKLPQHINIKLKQFVQSFITQKCQISLVLNVKICCFSLIYNHCTFNNRWLNKTDSEVRFESV